MLVCHSLVSYGYNQYIHEPLGAGRRLACLLKLKIKKKINENFRKTVYKEKIHMYFSVSVAEPQPEDSVQDESFSQKSLNLDRCKTELGDIFK